MINSLSNMISLFRLNRIIPEVIGFTTKIRSSNLDSLEIIRESEISRWVDTHRPESWVAVDDLDLSGLDPNFVHCIDTIKGISDETVKLSILQKLKY